MKSDPVIVTQQVSETLPADMDSTIVENILPHEVIRSSKVSDIASPIEKIKNLQENEVSTKKQKISTMKRRKIKLK